MFIKEIDTINKLSDRFLLNKYNGTLCDMQLELEELDIPDELIELYNHILLNDSLGLSFCPEGQMRAMSYNRLGFKMLLVLLIYINQGVDFKGLNWIKSTTNNQRTCVIMGTVMVLLLLYTPIANITNGWAIVLFIIHNLTYSYLSLRESYIMYRCVEYIRSRTS